MSNKKISEPKPKPEPRSKPKPRQADRPARDVSIDGSLRVVLGSEVLEIPAVQTFPGILGPAQIFDAEDRVRTYLEQNLLNPILAEFAQIVRDRQMEYRGRQDPLENGPPLLAGPVPAEPAPDVTYLPPGVPDDAD